MVTKERFIYDAEVLAVVDADTLKLRVDLGFNNFHVNRFRLARINCPEKNTKEGVEAKNIVSVLCPIGLVVALKSMKTDIYGRFVAEVQINEVTNLSDYLLSKQIAVEYKGGKLPK